MQRSWQIPSRELVMLPRNLPEDWRDSGVESWHSDEDSRTTATIKNNDNAFESATKLVLYKFNSRNAWALMKDSPRAALVLSGKVVWGEESDRSLSLTELTGSWLDCFYLPEALYQGQTSPCHFLGLPQVHGGRQKTMRWAEKLIESPNKEHLAFLKSKTMSCRLWWQSRAAGYLTWCCYLMFKVWAQWSPEVWTGRGHHE